MLTAELLIVAFFGSVVLLYEWPSIRREIARRRKLNAVWTRLCLAMDGLTSRIKLTSKLGKRQ